MNIGLALSVLVFLVGFGFYWWSSRPKLAEIGRIMFLVGLLVSLLQLHGGVALSIFKQ